MIENHTGFLDIHGLVIQCESPSDDLLNELLRPFKYFRRENGAPLCVVKVHEQRVPYESFPQVPAAFSTPRNIVYQDTGRKIIDYFGKGAVVQSANEPLFTIYSPDRNLLLESFYLLVLSLLGEYCDEEGLLRIHALGVSIDDTAVLVLLPQGSGKSTMARALMEHNEIRYISDDDPIVSKDGAILPFPRPLGVLDRDMLAGVPDKFIYSVDRMEFGRKYYLDSDYWNGRIETRALKNTVLIIGRRMMNGKPHITPATGGKILKSLIRDAVVGIGLYQGLEFILSRSDWNVLSKVPVVMKRFARARRLTRRSRHFEMMLGSDSLENAQVLKDFLISLNAGRKK